MELVLVAVITATGTVAVAVVGAVLGRRWGLPGIGREVQTQQAALITTLQAELAELRTQQKSDADEIGKLKGRVSALTEQLHEAQGRIARQQEELLSLYRLTGKTVPQPF